MRFLFVVHKNEEKAEQNSVLFHRLTLKERGLRPNGYFPLMRQPPRMANDSNFDRNPLRGCNYGLEGGAFLILGGATTALGGALLYPWGQQ